MAKTTKIIPFEKMSKKAQRAENNRRRNDWGSLNPVTRCSKNKKAYDRKDKSWKKAC